MAEIMNLERGVSIQVSNPETNEVRGDVRLMFYDSEEDIWTAVIIRTEDYEWHEVGDVVLYWIEPHYGQMREHFPNLDE